VIKLDHPGQSTELFDDYQPSSLGYLLNPSLFFTNVRREVLEDDKIISMINTSVLKVYFTDRKEPSYDWGYPSQLDDWYYDIPQRLDEFDSPIYVLIANPAKEVIST
jgi:hypothetical protein